MVEIYGYHRSDLGVEVPIKMARSKKRADIVIFRENEEHIQENITTIIEVKKEKIKPSDKKEGIEQLKSYMAPSLNCKYGIWVGNEKLVFKKDNGKFINIPDIPKYGESSIPIPIKKDLKPAVNLKQIFKRIHNYIYANQGFQKDKAFEELQKLIFIKVYDEQYNSSLKFYILPEERDIDLRNRVSELFEKVKRQYKYIFDKNDIINLNDAVLKYIVSELYNFSLLDTDIDVKGEAYEQIVGSNLRGDRGEFFTHRTVCDMTTEMILSLLPEDRLTSPGDLKILDPALGTGGFLISALQIIKKLFLGRKISSNELRNYVKDVSNENLFGLDFNPFLVKVAQMNMVMHGDGSSNILNANSLERPDNWSIYTREKIKFGTFDVVITNPPFGSKTKIDTPDILDQYEMINFDSKNSRKAIPPEQLFIERCLNFLKEGGYLGIVLPDSILSNPGLVWIRKFILKKTHIIASIDLPVETFQPHTGTQTSVLILQKKFKHEEKYDEAYDIFMAIPKKVGHDRRGNLLYKTTPDGQLLLDNTGNPIIDDDLPEVVNAFKHWLKEKGRI